MLLHYSGSTPYIVWSNNRQHGSNQHKEWVVLKTLVATAHARLGRGLMKVRKDRRALGISLDINLLSY